MKYGLIGEKLGHSFSKEIHEQIAHYSYELCQIPQDELSLFLEKREFCAVNVTIPYKEAVISHLDEISDMAREIGAVNTIVNRGGKLFGYNTDFFGMRELILKNKIDVSGKKALVLGSGGTSKTAQAVLKSLGAREVYRVSREKKDGTITYDEAKSEHTDAEILINTTPVGMWPNIYSSPIDIEIFPRLSGVVDAVYNPIRTKLVVDAKKKNIAATGGLYMLVCQAVKASEYFCDTKIDESIIDKIYNEMKIKSENIVLVGMPGVGKTTLGNLISKKLSRPIFDTDEEIVKKAGCSIPEIFKERGESAFRDMESQVIKELYNMGGVIIATGGGAVLREKNVDLLRENGRIYFLDRELGTILPTDDRPLSQNRQALEKLYHERYPIYLKSADVHIRLGITPERDAEKIIEDFIL